MEPFNWPTVISLCFLKSSITGEGAEHELPRLEAGHGQGQRGDGSGATAAATDGETDSADEHQGAWVFFVNPLVTPFSELVKNVS